VVVGVPVIAQVCGSRKRLPAGSSSGDEPEPARNYRQNEANGVQRVGQVVTCLSDGRGLKVGQAIALRTGI
jgi:hypothetical protein